MFFLAARQLVTVWRNRQMFVFSQMLILQSKCKFTREIAWIKTSDHSELPIRSMISFNQGSFSCLFSIICISGKSKRVRVIDRIRYFCWKTREKYVESVRWDPGSIEQSAGERDGFRARYPAFTFCVVDCEFWAVEQQWLFSISTNLWCNEYTSLGFDRGVRSAKSIGLLMSSVNVKAWISKNIVNAAYLRNQEIS